MQKILRTVRSEYGKEIRKDYEEQRLNISRHEFLEYDLREAGVTNTLSTVQKDNLLATEVVGGIGDKNFGKQFRQGNRIYDGNKNATALSAQPVGNAGGDTNLYTAKADDFQIPTIWYPKEQCYIAIRKLTPRECFRLQGWDDDKFEKAQFVNSNSQLYKQAGNGVTVSVIKAIAERLA